MKDEIADVLDELEDYVQKLKEMLYKYRIDKEIGVYKMGPREKVNKLSTKKRRPE